MRALTIIALAASLAAPAVFADCPVPVPVDSVPRGATASRDEMVAALQAIKTYNAAVAAYTECMKKTGGNDLKVDAVVGKLQAIADKFNEELRTFKARNGA